MKIEIRKSALGQEWQWSCPTCHYGMNVPWESSPSWGSAIEEILQHIEIHKEIGKREEWIPFL